MVPLRYELANGDTVEIVTSVRQNPSKDWLKFVKTGRARTKIRHYVLAEERERSVEIGRESVDRELKKWHLDVGRAEKDGEILKIAVDYSFKTESDFYAAVGYGRISPKIVVTKLIPPQERDKARAGVSEEKPVRKRTEHDQERRAGPGADRCHGQFRKMLQPIAGRPHTGIHHERQRSHYPQGGLRQSSRH